MDKSRKAIEGMFDRIAPFYDFLNRFLSFSLDVLWRRKAVASLDIGEGEQVLDIATGTGDLALEALKMDAACRIYGLDFSRGMMRMAGDKRDKRNLRDRYLLIEGDALLMPFKEQAFDKAMVAFGVRNVPDVDRLFRETHRVLKKGGKLAILELSVPQAAVIHGIYLFYFEKILPPIGRLLSRRSVAYHYLRDSVLDFYRPQQLEELLRLSGFRVVRSTSLTLGVCHLYLAKKPSA
jgi:demethylmenaquinone methyltransferase/2-methoxy-6-polyprenyl-1,4-benzoquinol methylase